MSFVSPGSQCWASRGNKTHPFHCGLSLSADYSTLILSLKFDQTRPLHYSEGKIKRFQQILNPQTEKINMKKGGQISISFLFWNIRHQIFYTFKQSLRRSFHLVVLICLLTLTSLCTAAPPLKKKKSARHVVPPRYFFRERAAVHRLYKYCKPVFGFSK